MKDEKDILADAIENLKNQPVPPGPSQSLKNQTLTELTKASANERAAIAPSNIAGLFLKFAAIIAISLLAGFGIGRLTSPKPPDLEQIQASIEPAIRKQLNNEMIQNLQTAINACYTRLRDDLSEQYRQDLNTAAIQILAASGSNTNKLLEDLVISINQAQQQNRQWVTASLNQLEQNRREDKALLSNAVVNLAAQTQDQIKLTKQEIAQFLSYALPEAINYESENPNIQN